MRICGEKVGLEKTVLDLTENMKNKNRRLFMDNYYNSYDLTLKLKSRNIYVEHLEIIDKAQKTCYRLKKLLERGKVFILKKRG